MRMDRLFLLSLAALLVAGASMPESVFARGGGGGGGGGRRGGGGGRRGGKGRKGGGQMDRKEFIESLEEEMRNADRDTRFQSGRKSDFEQILREKRSEVMNRHRRMGEDTHRSEDARTEVPR